MLGAIRRQWNFYELRPTGRSLGHWRVLGCDRQFKLLLRVYSSSPVTSNIGDLFCDVHVLLLNVFWLVLCVCSMYVSSVVYPLEEASRTLAPLFCYHSCPTASVPGVDYDTSHEGAREGSQQLRAGTTSTEDMN